MIAVVIPYYQRTSAPLRSALLSIQAQTLRLPLEVILVDDESPLPATDVLAELQGHLQLDVQLVRQSNTGAAGARNSGLDRVPADADFIAFLDSDDMWEPDHLESAIRALQDQGSRGADFYFSDHQRLDWDKSKFAQIGWDRRAHRCISDAHRIYAFDDRPAYPVMRDHLIQTSTVVCRAGLLRHLRFPTELVLGEDEVMWMRALATARATVFTLGLGVKMGRGVNISQGGTWGDARSQELLLQNLEYWSSVPRLLAEDDDVARLGRERTRMLYIELARTAAHRLRRFKSVPVGAILSHIGRRIRSSMSASG